MKNPALSAGLTTLRQTKKPEANENAVPETEIQDNNSAEPNEQKPAELDAKRKKLITVLGLTVAVTCIFIIVIVQQSKLQPIKDEYASILKEYQDGDYSDALEDIDYYRDFRKGKSQKYDSMVEDIYSDIEPALYNFIKTTPLDDIIIIDDSCDSYEEYYPNGKYLAEIKKVRQNAWDKEANKLLTTVIEDMRKGEYESAVKNIDILSNYTYVSADTLDSINEIKQTIASIPPTNYILVSGSESENVKVFDERTYSVTCPYCGHVNYFAKGDLYVDINLKEHSIGEIETSRHLMVCASPLAGGCRNVSSYYITVKYTRK